MTYIFKKALQKIVYQKRENDKLYPGKTNEESNFSNRPNTHLKAPGSIRMLKNALQDVKLQALIKEFTTTKLHSSELSSDSRSDNPTTDCKSSNESSWIGVGGRNNYPLQMDNSTYDSTYMSLDYQQKSLY